MTQRINVLKFGGSSLATPDHVRRVAGQIAERRRRGESLVVVVSAMGKSTETLMNLAGDISRDPPRRELDRLLSTGEYVSSALVSMELARQGCDAVSLSGAEAGIVTNDRHFNAAVDRVDTGRLAAELAAGRVAVVAGYQGMSPGGEVTTLGLGGSDTTAVVLAAALGTGHCEICSDIDGVYSADPRVVESARSIPSISHDEMVELARHGASVLNPRAVEHARDRGVAIHARSTFEPEAPGTWIRDVESDGARVVGVASHDAVLPLYFEAGDKRASAAAETLRRELDDDDVFIDHSGEPGSRRCLVIPAERLPEVSAFAEDIKKRFPGRVTVGPELSSVSAIGLGIGRAREAHKASARYCDAVGIERRQQFVVPHAITCVVASAHRGDLMNAFHQGFDCPSKEAA